MPRSKTTEFDALLAELMQLHGAALGPERSLKAFHSWPDLVKLDLALEAFPTRSIRDSAPRSWPEIHEIDGPAAHEGFSPDNAEYQLWFGTNRVPQFDAAGRVIGFSGERANLVSHGTCRVFIPKSHKIGSTGSTWWRRLVGVTDDRLKLLGMDAFGEPEFWSAIQQELSAFSGRSKQAVVFIHGYNVSFTDAALRAAQIGFDLSIQTPMAFFSWPSKGTLGGYTEDEATIDASEDAIEDFLVNFVEQSGASAVHLIAHSMGNRGVLRAVSRIADKARRKTGKYFGQAILAAADVDIDVFQQRYRAYQQLAERATLYVSSRDKAVGASQWLHGFPRVGLAPPMFVADGIDTINVTNVDLTMLGHGYVAESRAVLTDMHRLLSDGAPPSARFGLRQQFDPAGKAFWEVGA